MEKLAAWIRRHQLAAFYLITFAISWGPAPALIAVYRREQVLLAPLVFAAICGPGLAAILVSAAIDTRPRAGSRRGFWIALLAAWAAALLVYLADQIPSLETSLSPALLVLIAISVLPVAFVIACSRSRIETVRDLVGSLIRLRGVWGWALVALILLPAVVLLTLPINALLRDSPVLPLELPESGLAVAGLIIVNFLYQLFFFVGPGEEVGWRGFALPRLQARWSPLVAALLIAVFWTPWHGFLWYAEGRPVTTVYFWVEMFVGHGLFSIFIVWVCNRARGSVLVAALAHAASNVAVGILGPFSLADFGLTWSVGALALVLLDRMWRRLPAEHAVVYRPPEG
jgi:membrane protease YdiL (CAAX protease family)